MVVGFNHLLIKEAFAQANGLNFFEIPLLKVFSTNFLKQCIMGSLTGAVASQKVPEARDGEFELEKYQFVSAIVYTRLTARLTNQAGT